MLDANDLLINTYVGMNLNRIAPKLDIHYFGRGMWTKNIYLSKVHSKVLLFTFLVSRKSLNFLVLFLALCFIS